MHPDEIESLPTRPGVYLFRDGKGEILYVGKAKSLRARVRSYFRTGTGLPVRIRELVRRTASVETIVVGSEAEALILEANLIKEHRPRYNIQLRDDKRYPYIKVTLQEPFPRVFVTRNVRDDGSRYFGPYTTVGPLRQALEVVKRLYTVRSCRYDLPAEAPSRPCLDHHIGRCLAPCVGLQSQEAYRAMIGEILRVLEGDTDALRAEVAARMEEAVKALRFEEAAHLRDVLRGLEAMGGDQRVHRVGGGDQDLLAVARDGPLAAGVVLRIRGGLLLGRRIQRFEELGPEDDEPGLLSALAVRTYLGQGEEGLRDLPREVLLSADFPDRPLLEGILSREAGRKVRFHVPRRGEKRSLVELARGNARHALEDRVTALAYAADRADEILYELQDRLGLMVVPRLIVCFDVSHTQGTEVVASAVTFENGAPSKAGYRRMRIRGDWGNDDYRSMAEVVLRYFRRRMEEGAPLPDLVLLDGGKGQLRSARDALESLGLREVAAAALAKREEEVFLPGRKEPLLLSRRDPALRLLQRIRDEAHRFAVTYNRALRRRRTLRSRLEEIPGVGPRRRKMLLRRFGSVRGIRDATEEELTRISGIGPALARRIREHLNEAGGGRGSEAGRTDGGRRSERESAV